MSEFLEINQRYSKIQDFLKDKIFNNCQNIKLNWLLSINNHILYYENKPLQQRIKNFNYNNSANKLIKSTVRGNLPVNYWYNMSNPHTSILNITSCSSSGKIIASDLTHIFPPDFTNAKLKHYYYKSFEELCIKIKRGKCDLTKNISDKIIIEKYKILYEQSKNNPTKIKILNDVFGNSTTEFNIFKGSKNLSS